MYTKKDFIGFWKSDQRDAAEAPQDGDVTFEFNEDGTAKYCVYYPDRQDVVLLNYRIEGDYIVTEQNNSGLLKTKFLFERDGSLVIWFNSVKGRFLKR
jgi:hypothetical protein